MIYKIETQQGLIGYEFKDLQSAKDYAMAFLSWSGTRYRILKARQTVLHPITTADLYKETN